MHVAERELVRIADRIRQQLLLHQRTRCRIVQEKLGQAIGKIERLEAIRRKLAKCEARN
jgi:hypothetical protein